MKNRIKDFNSFISESKILHENKDWDDIDPKEFGEEFGEQWNCEGDSLRGIASWINGYAYNVLHSEKPSASNAWLDEVYDIACKIDKDLCKKVKRNTMEKLFNY